ncbi:MAG: hypothetical protein MI976_00080 [Pseudomonadales bacterium]|nr:hypothetical protein [Pseudomonadales bacterium]
MNILTYCCVNLLKKNPKTGLPIFLLFIGLFICYQILSEFQNQKTALFIGFLFYSLKSLHVLIDTYKGTIQRINLIEFSGYYLFFPTLLIGPINRYGEFIKDWNRQSFNRDNLSYGLERIVVGYAKLVILAGYIVGNLFHEYIQSYEDNIPRLFSYLSNVEYGLHLYFSFAGASDIAIGLGAALGFRICENFKNPFASLDIAEFWRRWHMSLTQWCKEYAYAGVVSLTRQHYIGILGTMLAIALWHEFSIRYVLWGLFHGIGLLVFYRWNAASAEMRKRTKAKPFLERIYQLAAWFVTINFVMLSFLITRSSSTTELIENIKILILGS